MNKFFKILLSLFIFSSLESYAATFVLYVKNNISQNPGPYPTPVMSLGTGTGKNSWKGVTKGQLISWTSNFQKIGTWTSVDLDTDSAWISFGAGSSYCQLDIKSGGGATPVFTPNQKYAGSISCKFTCNTSNCDHINLELDTAS